MKSKFVTWLENFKSVDLPIGDLANDVLSDKEFPKKSDKELILNHLRKKHACYEVIKTFEVVWDFYLKSK